MISETFGVAATVFRSALRAANPVSSLPQLDRPVSPAK
jgi:hypothetical protein